MSDSEPTATETPGADDAGKMSFFDHLTELRTRIIWSLIPSAVGLAIAFYFTDRIMVFLQRPLANLKTPPIFLTPTEYFWTYMKVAMITGVFIAMPIILWNVWAFVAPGLHKHERRYAAPFVIAGSLLFLGGGAFALLLVIPFAVHRRLHRLHHQVHAGLRGGVRAAGGDHAPVHARARDAPVPVQESQVRGADQLHHRGRPHPDPRHRQPDSDGGTPLHPLRARHHLRANIREEEAGEAGAHLREPHRVSPLEFTSLDLPGPVRRGIQDAGFVATTAIQEAALPLALRGKDVAGQSQTGTGKTAAFLIAAFTRCLTHPAPAGSGVTSPRVLIIAPTRELVVQIEADARLLGAHTGLQILSVYGGIDYNKQRDALRDGCDILVGTPGRLIDYLKQHIWSPGKVEVLVIDEADRMFDMGFIADLRFILRRLPKPEKRQSFLFSATLSFRVLELTWEFMNNPAQISITPQQKTVEKAEQVLYHVGREEKFNLLLGLLRREGGSRILIFSNTREEARRLEDRLSRNGWEARALTGDVDQKKRLKILNDFKDGQLPILVATDVASRGLHIEGVSHVVNWDMPQDAEDYVHRIGRTARAGAAGKAISLVDEAGALALEPIEKFIAQKIQVDWAEDDLYLSEIKPTSEERRRYAEEKRQRMAARGGGRGGGPGRPGGGGGGGRRDGRGPSRGPRR
jgi:ATP-dependent RNA helicase RhlB